GGAAPVDDGPSRWPIQRPAPLQPGLCSSGGTARRDTGSPPTAVLGEVAARSTPLNGPLTCSPKADPGAMRVSAGRAAQEILDERDESEAAQAAHARADHRQAA